MTLSVEDGEGNRPLGREVYTLLGPIFAPSNPHDPLFIVGPQSSETYPNWFAPFGTLSHSSPHVAVAADLDGDRLPDLVHSYFGGLGEDVSVHEPDGMGDFVRGGVGAEDDDAWVLASADFENPTGFRSDVDGYFHDSYFKHIVVDMDGDGNSDILRVAHSTFAVGTHYASGPDSPLVSMPGYAAHWYHGKRNAADQRPGIRSAPGTLLASSPIGRRDWRGSGPGDCSNSNALLGDMNGDGLVDLLFASSFGLDLYIQTQRSPELLHEVISDIGGSLAVQYQAPLSFAAAVQTTEEPSCSGGTAHSTCGAPASPGVWLVGRVVSEDGRGFEQSATYDYRNFRVVRGAARDRKMLGFETIVRLDERTGRRDTTTYYQDVGRHGLARRSEVHTAHGGHYWKWSDVVHEWAATPRYGAVVAGLEETKRTTTLFEDDWPVSEVIEHSEYDEHGYLTLRKSCPSYDACSALGTRFTHDVTAWRLGRVDYVTSWYGPRLTSNLRYLYSPGSMDAESIRQWWQPYAETASCTNTTELECGQEVLAGHGRWITIEKNRQFRWGVLTYREDADSHGEVFGLDTRWWTYTATHTNALGHVVRRRHDARGAVSASIDANLVTRHYDYDDFGRLVGERSSVGALTNLGRVTHADDRASRRFTTEAWADATSRQVETSFYGGFGDVYRKDRIDVDGTSIVRVEWTREWIAQPGGYSLLRSGRSDPYRCTLAQCDSAPRTEVTYDARARPLRVERVVDGLRRTMFTYSYGRDQQSATGAAVVVTDALGNVNEYYLDQHRRLSRILDAKQAETTYQHDGVGRLIAVALPNGDAVSAAYDLWGRRYRYSDSVSGDAWYSYYDIGDRLRERVDAEGRGFEQTYDALGRLDTRSAGGATTVFGYDDPTVSYGIGRLTSVTGAAPGVETRLAYDWAGRTARSEVLFPEYPDPFVREQEFDDLGRRTLTTLPDGTTLQNIHHPHGGPVSDVVVNGETLARYPEHTASGRALQIEAWRSSQDLLAVSYLTYDEENRLDEFVSELPQSLGLSDRTIQHYAYDYRDDGRILAVHDVRSNTQQGSVNTADDNFYSYDSLGRLVGAQGAYGTHVYKYDGLGNFSMFENVEVVGPYSCVSPGWACFEGIGDTGQTVWSYRNDRAGHRVAFEIGANETTYEYDQYGQLIAVLGSAGSLAAFEYDHAGRRVRKDELSSFGPGVTTLYPFDDYEVRYNNDDGPNSASVTRHYYGPSGHIASETAGVLLPNQLEPSDIETFLSKWSGDTSAGPPHGRWYNLPNHVGSTALTLHQDGVTRSHEAFASRVVYAPFGGVVEDASFGRDIATRKFAGKELDASTGLSYFGARYYDSVTGRFLTPDQNIVSHGTDPQGFNRYAYTLNDPVSYTDPTGEYPFVAGYNAAQFGLDASAKLTAFEQSIVTDRPGLGGVFFNTAVSSVADVSRGLLAITQVGTGAAAGVERISNAEDGWDVVIGVAQVLKDAGEVSGTVLHGTGAAVKMTTAAVKPASMAASSVSKASVNSARVAGTSRDAAGRLRNADGTFAPDGGRVRTPGGTHGNTAGDQPATLYEMYDADGNFLKHGISQDPASRYSRPELRGGFLVETESGPRKAMLKRERELVETNPGPLNREPWAGRRTQ